MRRSQSTSAVLLFGTHVTHCMPSSSITLSGRAARSFRSMDRTYNESIADRQDKFQWHQRHTFRPHSSHTHDPMDWGRQLTTLAQRKRGALDITQRLRNLEERQAEQQQNRRLIAAATGGQQTLTSSADVAHGTSSTSTNEQRGNEHYAAMIQGLMTNLDNSRRAMWPIKHRAHESSGAVLQATSNRKAVLLDIFDVIASTTTNQLHPDEPTRVLSGECLGNFWVELLQDAELLVQALLERGSAADQDAAAQHADRHPGSDTDEATISALNAVASLCLETFAGNDIVLQRNHRSGMVGGKGQQQQQHEVTSVESLLDELYVITHPLLTRMSTLLESSSSSSHQVAETDKEGQKDSLCSNETIKHLWETFMTTLRKKHHLQQVSSSGGDEGDDHEQLSEFRLHPQHISMLLTVLTRLTTTRKDVLQLLTADDDVVRAASTTVSYLLQREANQLASTAWTAHHNRQGAVARQQAHIQSITPHAPLQHHRVIQQRAVGPVSVPVPLPTSSIASKDEDAWPIEDEEVSTLMTSFRQCLELCEVSSATVFTLGRTLMNVMDLLEVSPNFHIGLGSLAPLLHSIVNSSLLDRQVFHQLAVQHGARSATGAAGGGRRLYLNGSSAQFNAHTIALGVRHRLLLLASRITLVGGNPECLQQLLWSIMEMRIEDVAAAAGLKQDEEEEGSSKESLVAQEQRRLFLECKRLRNMVLTKLINNALAPEFILVGAVEEATASSFYDNDLLLLHIAGCNVPLRHRTWHALVKRLVTLPDCSPGTAAALLALRTQVRNPQHQGRGDDGLVLLTEADNVSLSRLAMLITPDASRRRNGEGGSEGGGASMWRELIESREADMLSEAAEHPAAPLIDRQQLQEQLHALLAQSKHF